MRRFGSTSLVCVVVTSLAACVAGSSRRAASYDSVTDSVLAIVGATVIPMDRERVLPDQTVLVRNGVIARVGPAGSVAIGDGVARIDGRGRYLIPGLVDMHVHLRSESELLSYLAYGVTTITNLSGTTEDAPAPLPTKHRIERGELLGPALFTTGPSLDGDPPIFAAVSRIVTTPEQAVTAVEEQVAAGYDFIKIYNNIPPAAARAAIATAHARGRAVFGHIPRAGGRADALGRILDAGLDVIAHAEEYFFTEFYEGVDSLLDLGRVPVRDTAELRAVARRTRQANAAVIPNLSFVTMTRRQLDSLEAVFSDPEFRFLTPDVRSMWRRYNPTRRQELESFGRRERAKNVFVRQLTRALHEAGVELLLGTDASIPGLYPGLSAHLELEELVAAGLSPFEALAVGTRNAGEFVRRHLPGAARFGVIAPGYRADLVLIDGNPLENIAHAARIGGVVVHGHWYSRRELDRRRAAAAPSVP